MKFKASDILIGHSLESDLKALKVGNMGINLQSSVADPDPGSGAFLTPGSGIGFFRISDLGSRIPNPYF
jgi:hypothetical protein